MTTHHHVSPVLFRSPLTRLFEFAARKQPLSWALAKLQDGLARRRQLKVLATLDDRLLADIGLTREQVKAECEKSLWSS